MLSLVPLVGCIAIALVRTAVAESLSPQMQSLLDAHNSYRAKHCVPPLTWSNALADTARQWANRCDFDARRKFVLGHSGCLFTPGGRGELVCGD